MTSVVPRVVAAVDLGASGGRVIAGLVTPNSVELDEIHRFPNGVAEHDGHLRWDIATLLAEILDGLALLTASYPQVESIGIDTWGVDYGCLDSSFRLLADPIAYRDARTTAEVISAVHAHIPPEELYAVNGLQHLPFHTLYQLAAEAVGPLWSRIERIALIPDLIAHELTGVLATDYTNATTTGLIDVRTRTWSPELLDRLGIPAVLLPPVEQPGTVRGVLRAEIAAQIGLATPIPVITVGSHDTASAFVGVPVTELDAAIIASGTWSLVGVEVDEPIVTEAARSANFTNEGGVDGTIRFLRNVGGLWLLQECMRSWAESGQGHDIGELLRGAEHLPASTTLLDVDDPKWIPPGDMPDRIAEAITSSGGRAPASPCEITRLILDSLANAYAATIEQAEALTARAIPVVHMVGGGSQNELLCRLTANASGRPVVVGPVEATALGNVLVQARTIGAVEGTLADLRALVFRSAQLSRYEPW